MKSHYRAEKAHKQATSCLPGSVTRVWHQRLAVAVPAGVDGRTMLSSCGLRQQCCAQMQLALRSA